MPHESSQRVLLSMTLLALLWVAVYWAWGPPDGSRDAGLVELADTPRITFDREPAQAADPGAPPTAPPTAPPSDTLSVTPIGLDPTPGPGIIPPEFRAYTLRDGDTLESIARREYGDSSRWVAIARANPLRDAQRLRAGDVIRLPVDPDNVQGLALDARGEPTSPPAPPAPEYVEYLVKPGDTLSEIAQSYYGSFRFTRLILEANTDTISSADDLRAGQTLRLPAAPPSGPEGSP
ncbi:MAG: LysM peptidoglycan-binding domain-containing protein [Phycisphaerales bacterium JB040]